MAPKTGKAKPHKAKGEKKKKEEKGPANNFIILFSWFLYVYVELCEIFDQYY